MLRYKKLHFGRIVGIPRLPLGLVLGLGGSGLGLGLGLWGLGLGLGLGLGESLYKIENEAIFLSSER